MRPVAADPSVGASVVSFDDDAWEDLLNFVEERRVIPIVGPELLPVAGEAGPESLYAWFETRLGLPRAAAGRAPTLNEGNPERG